MLRIKNIIISIFRPSKNNENKLQNKPLETPTFSTQDLNKKLDDIETYFLIAVKKAEETYSFKMPPHTTSPKIPKYIKMIILNEVMKHQDYWTHYNSVSAIKFIRAIKNSFKNYQDHSLEWGFFTRFPDPNSTESGKMISKINNMISEAEEKLIPQSCLSCEQKFALWRNAKGVNDQKALFYAENAANQIIEFCQQSLKDKNNDTLFQKNPKLKKIIKAISRNAIFDNYDLMLLASGYPSENLAFQNKPRTYFAR